MIAFCIFGFSFIRLLVDFRIGVGCQHDPSARCQTVRAAAYPFGLSLLYLYLNASGKVEAHQSFNGLLVGVEDIDQSLVGSALKLLTAVLVLVNSAKDGDNGGALSRRVEEMREWVKSPEGIRADDG